MGGECTVASPLRSPARPRSLVRLNKVLEDAKLRKQSLSCLSVYSVVEDHVACARVLF